MSLEGIGQKVRSRQHGGQGLRLVVICLVDEVRRGTVFPPVQAPADAPGIRAGGD